MLRTIENIVKAISRYQLTLTSEKELQSQIEKIFREENIEFKREYRIDPNNKPDFFCSGIAVEIKIKGKPIQIYRQCKRYCENENVKALLLITNKAMGFPEQLNGKPCYIHNLGATWL